METPADIVIRLLGGEKTVSTVCKTDLSNVYRWRYPKKRGGTGGNVPSRHHAILLTHAKENGIPLEPAHLIQALLANDTENPIQPETTAEGATTPQP